MRGEPSRIGIVAAAIHFNSIPGNDDSIPEMAIIFRKRLFWLFENDFCCKIFRYQKNSWLLSVFRSCARQRTHENFLSRTKFTKKYVNNFVMVHRFFFVRQWLAFFRHQVPRGSGTKKNGHKLNFFHLITSIFMLVKNSHGSKLLNDPKM